MRGDEARNLDDEPPKVIKSMSLENGGTEDLPLPTVDLYDLIGKTIIRKYKVDNSNQRGKIIKMLEDEVDDRDKKFLVEFGEGG